MTTPMNINNGDDEMAEGEVLAVTQADRHAAYIFACKNRINPSRIYEAAFMRGDWDHTEDVQAFARHRIKALASISPTPPAVGEAQELESGKDELRRLMDSIWRAEFMKEAPNWRPLDDLPGMVSQIDNMYAGVRNERDQAPAATATLRPSSPDVDYLNLVARYFETRPCSDGDMLASNESNAEKCRALADRIEVFALSGIAADTFDRAPKHTYWGAGDPDCPREIKASNGELCRLRCKVCGLDNPRDPICHADALFDEAEAAPAEPESKLAAWMKANPDLVPTPTERGRGESAVREALEPFAELADNFVGQDENDADLYSPPLYEHQMRVRVGWLRAAARALATTEGRTTDKGETL